MTGVAEPEDEDEEAVEPELDDEPASDDPDATEAVVVEAGAVVVWLRASAGSWPETSWTKIPPVQARKIAVATPTTRRRMWRTRWRRICRGVEGMTSASTPFFVTA